MYIEKDLNSFFLRDIEKQVAFVVYHHRDHLREWAYISDNNQFAPTFGANVLLETYIHVTLIYWVLNIN